MTKISIRIDRAVYERLKAVAEKEHLTLGETITLLLDRHEQQVLRRAVHESSRRLHNAPPHGKTTGER